MTGRSRALAAAAMLSAVCLSVLLVLVASRAPASRVPNALSIAPTTTLGRPIYAYDLGVPQQLDWQRTRHVVGGERGSQRGESSSRLSRGRLASLHGVAANTEAVLVDGAGSGTRAINIRPNASDPNRGPTRAHIEKHLFGGGPTSLRSIDPAGTTDQWVAYMQDLAGRPATATLKGGIQDIFGTFPKADGSGSFRFGIRIARGDDGTFDLVTLLTRR